MIHPAEMPDYRFLYAIFIPFVSQLVPEALAELEEELKGVDSIEDIPNKIIRSTNPQAYRFNPRREGGRNILNDAELIHAVEFPEQNLPVSDPRTILNNATLTYNFFQMDNDGNLSLTLRGLRKFFSLEAQLQESGDLKTNPIAPTITEVNPALKRLMPQHQM